MWKKFIRLINRLIMDANKPLPKAISENSISFEILDGVAKGTQSIISVSTDGEKTICNINTNAKLSLKAAILYPIIKKEYEGILTKVLRKIIVKINE